MAEVVSAEIIKIAEAVKTQLEAAAETASQEYTVERVYLPTYSETKDTGCKIFVLGLAQAITSSTRASDSFVYNVKIAIYEKVDAKVVAEIDEMVLFTEQVIDLFRRNKKLAGYEQALLKDVLNEAVYDPSMLDEHNMFVSVITLGFELLRAQ